MRPQEEQEQLIFFINELKENTEILLSTSIVQHLQSRRSLELGQLLTLSTGDNWSCAQLISVSKKGVWAQVKEIFPVQRQASGVHLFQSIIKPESFAWIVQKATEMNVDSMTPIWAHRSQRHYWSDSKKEHYLKIIQSACAQSERLSPLKLYDPKNIAELKDQKNLSWVKGDFQGQRWSSLHLNYPLGILIGPEGGFDAQDSGLLPHSQDVYLGQGILRAETAAIVMCGLALCS